MPPPLPHRTRHRAAAVRVCMCVCVCGVAVAPAPHRRVPPSFTTGAKDPGAGRRVPAGSGYAGAGAALLAAAQAAAGRLADEEIICGEGEDGVPRCMYRVNGFTCLQAGAPEAHRGAADACAWDQDWQLASTPCWSAPPEAQTRDRAFAHWMPGDSVAVDLLNRAHASSERVTTCYEMAVRAAVETPAHFTEFKRDPRYTAVLEHVDPARGLEYLQHIGRQNLEAAPLDRVLANDEIGRPRTCFYTRLGRFASPTTLRYLKFAFDIRAWFGSLDGMRVVEVGGGYGGLGKVLFDLNPGIASYATYDIPPVLKLVAKYHASMRTLEVARAEGRCCEYRDGTDAKQFAKHGAGDIFISYYALTELTDEHATHYLTAVAARCPHGLIELERAKYSRWQRDSRLRQIEALYGPLTVVPERPSTGDNLFVGWGLIDAARTEL